MKKVLLVAYLAIVTACSINAQKESVWGNRVIACGDSDVYIINTTSTSDSLSVEWHWNISEAKGQIPDVYQERNRSIDDCKAVNNQKDLLITSSSNSTILLEIDTKKVLFYANTPMAHSADLLPKGRIAVANSVHEKGNSLELYDISKPEECIWKDSLYFGHGSVWMDKEQCLYALGYKELRRYRLSNWDTSSPSLILEETIEFPDDGGHELSKVNDNTLLCSGHNNVYLFNTDTKQFSIFTPLSGKKNIKSANYDMKSGCIIFTQAEESWWTNHVYITKPEKALTFDKKFHLYKVRVL